ncbi:MAG: hypothetical protein ACLPYS_20295 [Vulcanimicrobiaceae bacterium]
MGASATLTIPLSLATAEQRDAAQEILGSAAGTSDVEIDPAGSKALVRIQMPGNIDSLMGKLYRAGLTTTQTIDVSIPVKRMTDNPVDPIELVRDLNWSPAVTNATYDGRTVTATIAAATNAMRYIFEELIHNGLMPQDNATIPSPTGFII